MSQSAGRRGPLSDLVCALLAEGSLAIERAPAEPATNREANLSALDRSTNPAAGSDRV